MKEYLLGMIVLIAIAGCVTVGTEALKDLRGDWPTLETGKAEIEARLGPPSMRAITMTDGRRAESWGYTYSRVEWNPWLWVPVAGLIALICCDTVTMEVHSLVVTFDDQGSIIGMARQDGPLEALFLTNTRR